MLPSSYNHSFIVQATVITIINYEHTVITIINYNCKTFIVQATGVPDSHANIFYNITQGLYLTSRNGLSLVTLISETVITKNTNFSAKIFNNFLHFKLVTN
jgi:hypothetical protein